jgi:arylsulfatase A-like enzyme
VPLMVRWPGVTKADSTSTVMLHAVDMYPTLAAIGGAKLPEAKVHPLDGESFAVILRGSQAEMHRKAIYWHFPGYMDDRAVPVTSIIKNTGGGDRYKLLYFYEPRRYELYKLSADIGEKNDLLEGKPDASVTAVATDLRNDMLAWLAKMKPPVMKYRAGGMEVPGPVPFAEATRKPTGVREGQNRRPGRQ